MGGKRLDYSNISQFTDFMPHLQEGNILVSMVFCVNCIPLEAFRQTIMSGMIITIIFIPREFLW